MSLRAYLTDFLRFLRYFGRRFLTVGLTLFTGIFLTVVAANHTGQLDSSLESKINTMATSRWRTIYGPAGSAVSEDRRAELDQIRLELADELGLNDPFLQRHLRYTLNSLRLDWGDVQFTSFRTRGWFQEEDTSARAIIFSHLPNTLLLVGASNLLIFLFGIPLALFVSRHYGSWLDRLMSLLAPVSSIPSWVLGLLLVVIFAIELRLLPVSGMRGIITDVSPLGQNLDLLRHLILPVAAIVLSQLFQLVFTWRSYLLVYANEDYVELAKAKGLHARTIQRKYILRSAAPFILTSFALTLVGFWQTTIALEIVFDWPGIGQLFIRSLPHFFGESMFPGEMVMTVGLVVLFGYILAFTVLILDFAYALLDPRIRLDQHSPEGREARLRRGLWRRAPAWQPPTRPRRSAGQWLTRLDDLRQALAAGAKRGGAVFGELLRYPTALVGLVIVSLLIFGSLTAVITLPYADIADQWRVSSVTGRIEVPRLAQPGWVADVQGRNLLSQQFVDSRQPGPDITKTVTTQADGNTKVILQLAFDYSYDLPPEEVLLYFYPQFSGKRPFVFWSWTLPDGERVELNQLSLGGADRVSLTEHVFRGPRGFTQARALRPDLADQPDAALPKLWLFSGPLGTEPLQTGRYVLEIDALFFEPAADLDAELVLLGQTYGVAGTDMFRRDLILPLLWGMPFALIFGLLGATLTVAVSMSAAAIGVWYRGWADTIIQRVADANLILPVLAISVVIYSYFGVSLWTILAFIILLSAFGSPLKTFRAAFLQVISEPYIESARAYGASNARIIFGYMLPRIFPVIIPQLIALIPAFVFLEATLGMFNIRTIYPTWGKVIYEAINSGVSYGSRFWVLQPLGLLLLTGLGFALLGYALDRVLNPSLKDV